MPRADVEIKVGADTRDFKTAVKGLTTELQRGIDTARRLEKEAVQGANSAARATLTQQKAVTALVLELAKSQRIAAEASKEEREAANASVKAARDRLRVGRTRLQALKSEEAAANKQLALSRRLVREETRRLRLAKEQARIQAGVPRALEGLRGVLSTVSVGAISYRLIQGIARLPGLIREATDNWKLYSNQLRIVTQNEQELVELRGRLIGISVETFSQIQGTITTYARLARATRTLSISQKELLDISRAINQAAKIGGATSRESLAAQIQFSQALASGRFSGDELRSVFEQLPRLAQAIAEGLGVGIGKLREFGEQGKLTATVLTNSILSQTEKLNEEFLRIAPTVEQGTLALFDSLTGAVGQLDSIVGLSDKLARDLLGSAELINALAGNTSDVANASATAASEYEKLLTRASALREELDQIRQSTAADVSFDPRSLGAGLALISTESRELTDNIARVTSELSKVEDELRSLGTGGESYLERVLRQTEEIQRAAGALDLSELSAPEVDPGIQERIRNELHLLSLRAEGNEEAEREIRLFQRLQQGYTQEQEAQAEFYYQRIQQIESLRQEGIRLSKESSRAETQRLREARRAARSIRTIEVPSLFHPGSILRESEEIVRAVDVVEEAIERIPSLFREGERPILGPQVFSLEDARRFQREIEQIYKDQEEQAKQARERVLEEQRAALREQQRLAEQTASIVGRGIENVFIGIAEASERGISAARALRGALLRLLGSFAHLGLSRLLGSTLTRLGSIPGLPGRQFGGPVYAGQSYLVGERGPEVFTPDRSGHISPNLRGGVTIQQIIQSTDGPGVRSALRVGEPALVRAATLLSSQQLIINQNRPSPQNI